MASAPSQATLTVKNGPDAGKVVDLPEGELLIGRIEPAGLVVNDSEVSRRHARLNCRGGGFYVEDLGSVNGTQLDGEPVRDPRPLRNGAIIRIGTSILKFLAGPEYR